MSVLKVISNTSALVIYSPLLSGETLTEFEKFIVSGNSHTEPALIQDFNEIGARIKKMSLSCGARANLFRVEGKRNDNVVALPLLQKWRSKAIGVLRLYCIRVSDQVLIIGNGGIKRVQKYQQDPVLFSHVRLLQRIDNKIQREFNSLEIDAEDCNSVISVLNNLVF